MSDNTQFKDKVVLVTGASSGIGKAAALEYARRGAIVVGAARGAAEELEALAKKEGLNISYLQADVSVEADVDHLVSTIVEKHGRLDIAFNNAGISGVHAPIVNAELKDWDRIIAVNLTSNFLLMRAETRQMLKQGSGAIVNTSSIGGLTGASNLAAYAASKSGLIGLSKVVAMEYARFGIRVNVVVPGYTITPMTDKTSTIISNFKEHSEEATPMHRGADPLEVAHLALWLSSDEASFVTGQVVAADGGYLLNGMPLVEKPEIL
ncbi:SDR family NAD(P)-dependent oxidoreductase [Acinetobacter stercoris]|uniref:Levodione reductase n=1 Tax=Acinetobacter stercoris TaxID=2126983 RepID=A0A2U3N2I4_9GAMM|nr:SDR family NAD(P)-dependent oxidoreductase [Acinetobacter stercoris]SPL71825.1 Levodione reductase [Acinetobacter stercoris]